MGDVDPGLWEQNINAPSKPVSSMSDMTAHMQTHTVTHKYSSFCWRLLFSSELSTVAAAVNECVLVCECVLLCGGACFAFSLCQFLNFNALA